MRRRRFRKFGERIFFTQINAGDLYHHKVFEIPRKLKLVLGTRTEAEARKTATAMFIEMMHMILDDMIEEQAQFLFPYPKFGIMRIFDITDVVHPDIYWFDPNTNGHVYAVYILRPFDSKLKFFYMTRLWKHVYHKIRCYVKEYGSGYPKPPPQEQQIRNRGYGRLNAYTKPQGDKLRTKRSD